MTEIARIIDELSASTTGIRGTARRCRRFSRASTAPRAAARPIPGAHSIWELVLHMTAWKNETARRLAGARRLHADRRRLAGGWRADGGALAGGDGPARSGAPSLIAAVKTLPEAKLYEPTNDTRSGPLGTGVPYYVLLHGIVQHDVYHAGQIALLKKAI